MSTKYWRYTIKGALPTNSIHTVLGNTIFHGLVVRIHSQRGKTNVYVAASEPPPKRGRSRSRETVIVPIEVSEEEATSLAPT